MTLEGGAGMALRTSKLGRKYPREVHDNFKWSLSDRSSVEDYLCLHHSGTFLIVHHSGTFLIV